MAAIICAGAAPVKYDEHEDFNSYVQWFYDKKKSLKDRMKENLNSKLVRLPSSGSVCMASKRSKLLSVSAVDDNVENREIPWEDSDEDEKSTVLKDTHVELDTLQQAKSRYYGIKAQKFDDFDDYRKRAHLNDFHHTCTKYF